MRTSENTAKLMQALAKAQAELEDPKQSQRGHHGTYASLADGLPGARRVLARHGVAILQAVNLEAAAVVTRLACGGEWIEGDYPLIMNSSKPQQQGANTTYARRYALWAMLGLAPEDDDGQSSNDSSKGNHRNWQKQPPKRAPAYSADSPRDPDAWVGFAAELDKIGWGVDHLASFLQWSGGKAAPWQMSADSRFAVLQKLAEPDEATRDKIERWEASRGA